MPDNDALAAYLTDHLAGSTAGRDMARKLVEESEGTPLYPVMQSLLDDIEADRAWLQELMDRLGVTSQSIKEVGTWAAEKLSRLRFSEAITRNRALSQFMRMEALLVGIEGKRALWEALGRIAHTDPILADADFEVLTKRAVDQLDRLNRVRLDAAEEALAG